MQGIDKSGQSYRKSHFINFFSSGSGAGGDIGSNISVLSVWGIKPLLPMGGGGAWSPSAPVKDYLLAPLKINIFLQILALLCLAYISLIYNHFHYFSPKFPQPCCAQCNFLTSGSGYISQKYVTIEQFYHILTHF